jgi:hypothetical protein
MNFTKSWKKQRTIFPLHNRVFGNALDPEFITVCIWGLIDSFSPIRFTIVNKENCVLAIGWQRHEETTVQKKKKE